MEDGVTKVQSFLSAPGHNSSEDGSKREDNEEKEEGFVSKEKVEKGKQDDLSRDEAKESSGNGRGLINNLISTFITPSSPRTGKATTEIESGNGAGEDGGGGDGEEVENGELGRGLIGNLVTNFFHRNESEENVVEKSDKEKEDVEILGDEKNKRLKTGNEANSGGRGIIHDIVSHLPASLPDDAAPTADEATILINSLVRD